MGMQIQQHYFVSPKLNAVLSPSLLTNVSSSLVPSLNKKHKQHQISSINGVALRLKYDPLFGKYNKKSQQSYKVVASAAASSSSGNTNVSTAAPLWDTWSPDKATPIPSLSDVLWPSLGAFVGMAMLGKMDQMLAPKGLSMTIAPLGAVCAVLFVTPKAPAARKYNMFMAQIGCAALGVLAFTILGPGWLARGAALSASLAFMIYTRSTHPPAASLPLLFIDGAKLHGLNYWYALFPGAAGCILLSLIQEIVYYLKENVKF